MKIIEKTKKMKPTTFNYLGYDFIPSIQDMKNTYNWIELSQRIWGWGEETGLIEINENFNWDDFYKVAELNGCGKIDVFIMNGEKVIPCHKLRYFGRPSWYNGAKVK